MAKHESGVNYENLIRDLAAMYSYEVAVVVVVELVANSLDAGARTIAVDYDPEKGELIVVDDGKGMDASQFEQYHDFAAGLKTRGAGIGFAGVGAKISFDIADKVITQTRSKSFTAGSSWYLASTKKVIWEDIEPEGLGSTGTSVRIHFKKNADVPYGSSEDLVKLLRRH